MMECLLKRGTQDMGVILSFICIVYISATSGLNADPELTKTFLEATEPASLKKLLVDVPDGYSLNTSCLDAPIDYTNLKSCLTSQCVSVGDLAALYNVSADAELMRDELSVVAPGVVFSLQQSASCLSGDDDRLHKKPSSAAVWGYSFLFVTLINLCSLTGILVLPCMKMAIYKTLLMFMVALAVGTLLASGVLVLIPEAFELVGGESEEDSLDYIFKASTIVGGVYLFFVTERIMRMVNEWRENTKERKELDEYVTRASFTSSFTRKTPANASLKLKDPTTVPVHRSAGPCACIEENEEESSSVSDKSPLPSNKNSVSEKVDYNEEDPINGKVSETNRRMHGAVPEDTPRRRGLRRRGRGSSHHHQRQVAPVAYMIIFGDGLHNFIDGLSIGAAFTDNILTGVSVAVAVMCEELPHELGDFAILLNAGMRLKRALCYNFLSSLMCYLGTVIGILLGENTMAHTWIFGLAGGMFLYISLADMMPEMNSAAESEDGRRFGVKKTFLLQNVGLITGYCIILLIAIFGGHINFE